MPDLDDQLQRRLQASAPTPRTDGVFERVTRKWQRRRRAQRAGMPLLAVIVVAGTVLSLQPLRGAFRNDDGGGGVITFSRTLRGCSGHENVSGPDIDAFATSVDGSREWDLTADGTFSGDAFRGAPFEGVLRNEESVTLSPDGMKLAWIDHYVGGLYVTDLMSGETRWIAKELMPVGDPAWSPDGRSIAVSAVLQEERQGNVFFYPSPGFKIFAVDPSTGRASQLSDPPQTESPATASDIAPTWSPDGRTIAFLRGGSAVAEIDPETGNVEAFVDSAQSLWLMDADGSNPRQMDEAPSSADFSIVQADWSPDGRRFVAEVAFANGNHDLFVIDIATRSGYRLTDFIGEDASPSWSPDGQWIAFSTGRWGTGPGHSEIAAIRSDGSDLTQVTDDCWDDFGPEWVKESGLIESLPTWTPPPPPDLGTTGFADPGDILLTVNTFGITDLAALDPVTGELTKITADLLLQSDPSWSPDHTRIAFSGAIDNPENIDIYVMDIDGSDLQRITSDQASEGRPVWSPDGTHIAYEREDGIWIVGSDGSDPHTVAGEPAPGGYYPTWSPDGARLAFSLDGALVVVDIDGSNQMQITDGTSSEGGGSAYEVRWSLDGSRLLFTCGRDICLIDPNGENRVNLTEGPEDFYERSADWSPDGTQILFTSDRIQDVDGNVAFFVMDADGANIRQLSDPMSGCCSGSPDW